MKHLTLWAAAILTILSVSSCRLHSGMNRDNNRFGNQEERNQRNDNDNQQGSSNWGGQQQGDRPSFGQFNQ